MVVSSTQHGENTAFFSGFSLADFMAETLYRLFPPNFKEKASTIFMTQPLKKASSKNFRLLDSGGYRGASFAGFPERNPTTRRSFSGGGPVEGAFCRALS
ncbi:hypothetical protein [Bilophila sp.]|uniref:hypothetical protein n=1 Tax=Bilophila sp. TaxID=1929485 RepID=UPI0030773CAB